MQRAGKWKVERRAAALLLAAVAGCDELPTPPAAPTPEHEFAAAVRALGFQTEGMQEIGEYVLAEGDVLLRKSQLGPAARPAPGAMAPRFQYRTAQLVGSAIVAEIRVDITELARFPGWQEAARAAMAEWSAVPESYVGMVEGPQAHIRVLFECLAPTTRGWAEFPYGGLPGRVIVINSCMEFELAAEQKKRVMLHELGHTIGFRHTNWADRDETEPAHIPGTPGAEGDDASVMNSGDDDPGLSHYDRVAVRTLYPLPLPTWTVTRDGSFPRVTWSYPAGATGQYSLRLLHNRYDRYGRLPPETINEEWLLASGSGLTTLHDTGHTWTGASSCSVMTTNYTRKEAWLYEMTIHFRNGATRATGPAPVATC